MTNTSPHIQDMCLAVLATAHPASKAENALETAKLWKNGTLDCGGTWKISNSIGEPARPDNPELIPPGKTPRRRLSSVQGRIALLHAIAHIEFNAIDLAFDLIARFGNEACFSPENQQDFITDWINVGEDEARHFKMVENRLNDLDAKYGDLPAHNGLWEAAESTRHDLSARLAIAPLVLEARGLDVTPPMIEKLMSAGDSCSADILRVIYKEEITHVAAGARWFKYICNNRNLPPKNHFQNLVKKHFKGLVKPPFNTEARDLADLSADFYEPLSVQGSGLA